MADMKKFTIESDAALVHYTERGNCVIVDDERLVDVIARNFGFPSEDEWETMYQRLNQLREQNLMPAGDEPDIERPVKLRITVEVVE